MNVISATSAWSLATGSRNTRVCVVDTGTYGMTACLCVEHLTNEMMCHDTIQQCADVTASVLVVVA